ncbi:unnamed protein product [Merluccius merluccius]
MQVAPQYSQPSEDETIFVRVHPCESDGATDCLVVPPPRLGDDSNTELASDETERVGSTPDCSSSTAGEDSELATEEVELSADQAGLATQDSRDDNEDTPLQEYLEVLPLSQSSPYHSQNAAPPPAPKSSKDCRRLAGKKHSNFPLLPNLVLHLEGLPRLSLVINLFLIPKSIRCQTRFELLGSFFQDLTTRSWRTGASPEPRAHGSSPFERMQEM